ncbi:TPA: hypothetical protein DCY65_01750 [Candidatus Acetothermia bacterium]|nr:hypothetical protein [Candidatus Acetothermia bacterium]
MKNERYVKFGAALVLCVLVAGLATTVSTRLDARRSGGELPPPFPTGSPTVVRFGDVAVCQDAREIRFAGEVRQAEGSVLLLLHLTGYQWLEQEAAIVSPSRLVDLQQAIALLDWRLWDRLWQGEREAGGAAVEVRIGWGGEEESATDLLDTRYSLGLGDLVYLGSPLFDPLFLARCERTALCVALIRRDQCPLFLLHDAIEEQLARDCGQRGYRLNPGRLPPVGTPVTVLIRVPCAARGPDDRDRG